MADTIDINSKGKITTIDSSDQLFVSDQGNMLKKIDYNVLAKAIIEQYNASQLAGASQSVKAALDALNSNLPYVGTGTIASAIASKVTAGVNHGFFLAKNDLADAPSGAYYKIEYIRVTGTSNVYVKAYANHATDNTYEAMFDYTNVTSLSGLWTKFPTRAEVDKLNNALIKDYGPIGNNKTYVESFEYLANQLPAGVPIMGTYNSSGAKVFWGYLYNERNYGMFEVINYTGNRATVILDNGTWRTV